MNKIGILKVQKVTMAKKILKIAKNVELLHFKMVLFIKDNGKMIKDMGMVLNSGQTKQNSQDIGKMIKSTEKVSLNIVMVMCLKESGKMK